MEEQPTLQRMIVNEFRSRPSSSDSNQRVVTINGYGTDLNRYRFEVKLPITVAEQIQPGQYITVVLNDEGVIQTLLWAFRATDNRNAVASELKRISIHDISLNVRVSGMVADPADFFVQVGGYPSIGNPYIVEFDAPLETARKLKKGSTVDLLVDADSVARKILIGDDVIDVTHVGKL